MRPMLILVLGLAACSFSPPQGQPADLDDGPPPIDVSDVIIDAPPALIDAKVFLDAPIDAPFDPAAQCPGTYDIALVDATSSSRYRVILTTASWPTQAADCANDLAGATHLVVFETVTEAQMLGAATGTPSTYHVGYLQEPNQPTVGAGWHTVIGDDVAGDSAIWATGQPNDNAGVENNQQNFSFVGEDSLLVQDGPANFPAAAICECDGKPIVPLPGA
ncbi:MAG: hypothetical protein ABI867_37675 [Kofleriaceae bacterium]